MTMMNPKKDDAAASRTGRLNADDWAAAALKQMAEQGVASVAVEPLARTLGVTKGSFYWHFPSRDALLQAALDRWEGDEQSKVFAPLDRIPGPEDRLATLFTRVGEDADSHRVYAALLQAADHPVVAPVLARMTRQRINYLCRTFEMAGLSPEDARHRAWLAYAAYVGFIQLNVRLQQADMQREDFEGYVAHVGRTLIPRRGDAAFS